MLEKPPEQQDWDLEIHPTFSLTGHTGGDFLTWGFLEGGNFRWTEFDTSYENMFKDMATTPNPEEQEAKIQQMVKYIYDRAQVLFVYSPLTLYAVNKEVNFVPQKSEFLRLKETSVTENHWSIREENQ